jgi:hypothetical protein
MQPANQLRVEPLGEVIDFPNDDLRCAGCRRVLVPGYLKLLRDGEPAIRLTCMPCVDCGCANQQS